MAVKRSFDGQARDSFGHD